MADIVEIGFSVSTSSLEKGEKSLDRVAESAMGVSTASKQMEKALEGASASAASAAVAAARVVKAKADAVMKNLLANKESTVEERKLANEIRKKTAAVLADTIAQQKNTLAANANAAAARKQTAVAALAAPTLVVNRGPTIANDQMPNRFNTGNIAAQFQDIGVTAAMGMNPLMIAMQQGTQLSAIFNSMEKPLAGLAIALKSVFNLVSLGTIAIVALVAAGLQFINWTGLAKSALNGIANGIDFLAEHIRAVVPYILGLGAALVLWYSPAIITGLYTLSVSIVAVGASALTAGAEMAGAWVIGMGPVAWVIAGILAVSAAFAAFGGDAVGYMKTAANGIIGTMVGAYNTVLATWKMLPAAMGGIIIETTNFVLSGINNMINGFISMINGLLNALPESLRPKGGNLITFQMKGEFANPFADELAKYEKVAGEEFSKALKKDYVNAAGEAVKSLASSASAGLRSFANTLGVEKDKKSSGKTDEEKFEDIIKGADRKIASLHAEREAIGLTEFATAKLRFETELLNEAHQKGIELTPLGTQQLMERANTMALLTEEIRIQKENLEFAKSTTKSFFSDMVGGLRQGESAWESFSKAAVNALNKIIDKMMEANIEQMFGGSGAGGLGGLGKLANSLFGSMIGVQSAVQSSIAANPALFAKGGAFTNTLVSKPTAFAFANGGSFGVMGEAGPEAVMPLHRGSDGSLGVKMSGASNDNQSSGDDENTGNTYYIDARGADQGAVARLEQALLLYAGPGVVERRVMNAQVRGAI